MEPITPEEYLKLTPEQRREHSARFNGRTIEPIPQPSPEPSPSISTAEKNVWRAVVLVVLMIGGILVYRLTMKPEWDRQAEQAKQEAILDASYLDAQAAVKRAIKTPASAVFPPRSECRLDGRVGIGEWTGYFDAQNTYGAMVRGYFRVYSWKTATAYISDQPFEPDPKH